MVLLADLGDFCRVDGGLCGGGNVGCGVVGCSVRDSGLGDGVGGSIIGDLMEVNEVVLVLVLVVLYMANW